MAAAFVPKAYTNGKRTEIANSPQEEANLLWDGWWVTGSYTPPPSPDFVTEGELAPVAKTGAYGDLTGKPTIPAAYTDEQVRDVIGSALVAGANVTITPNDAADTITISSSAALTEADYVVSISGSTVTATPRGGSLTAYSGTNASTVIQAAIDALTPAGGNGTGGGRIHITRGVYFLNAALKIVGWEGGTNPYSQLVIEGDGYSTQLVQNTAGQNGIVVTNGANFALRDLRMYAGSGARSCLLGDKTGAVTEMSCYKSTIDNVSFLSNSTGYPAVYLKNFFDLSAPSMHVENSANHGLVLENDSTTTNYGNSNFGFLRCTGSSSAPYAALALRTVNGVKILNLLTFQNFEGTAAYYGLYVSGCRYTKVGFADIEGVPRPVYFDGTSGGIETRNVRIDSGYLFPSGTGPAITNTLYTGGNTFDAYIESATGATLVPILDQSQSRPVNDYNVRLGLTAPAANISVANSATRVRIRHVDGTVTDTSSANAVILVHGANAAQARPATPLPVVWFGSVQPNNLADGDVYVPATAN